MAYVCENNTEKYVVVCAKNQQDITISFEFLQKGIRMIIKNHFKPNINDVKECNIVIYNGNNNTNIHNGKFKYDVKNTYTYFYVDNIDFTQIFYEMEKGRLISFRIVDNDVVSYDTSFSLYGFKAMKQYETELYEKVLGY